MTSSRQMTCEGLAQAVTAYLENALSPPERERFEAHARVCPNCRRQLEQWQSFVRSLGRLKKRAAGVRAVEREKLLRLFREQGLHRPERPRPRVPLGVADGLIAPGDHLAYFWETEHELEAAAGFVKAGTNGGETCLLLGYAEANEHLAAAIERGGVDTKGLRREKRLRFLSGKNTSDVLLEALGEEILRAVDRGAPLVRILGNLGWGRPGWPGDRDLLRLEARVADVIRKLPVVLMCAYPVDGVSARILMLGGFECHPFLCRHQVLRPNELYVPSGPFLAALDEDASKE